MRICKNHRESARIIENLQELSRINKNQSLDLFENQFQTYLRIIENWWESGFRLIQESMRIQFQTYSRIIKNQWELLRINKNQGLDLFENQWESIPDLLKNQWGSEFRLVQESMRINYKLIWELARINENQGLDLFKNQRESIPDLFKNQWESGFRLIRESLRINFMLIRESMRIIKNQIKYKVLPLRWSKAKWHRYMKIKVFIVIRIDSANHYHFPTQSNPLNRPHSCPSRQQLKWSKMLHRASFSEFLICRYQKHQLGKSTGKFCVVTKKLEYTCDFGHEKTIENKFPVSLSIFLSSLLITLISAIFIVPF